MILNPTHRLFEHVALALDLPRAARAWLSGRPRLPKPAARACVVIGNGPSLESTLQTAAEWLTQQDCFTVNSFASTPWFARLRPRYYTLVDPLWFRLLRDAELGLQSKYAHLSHVFDRLVGDTTWPLTLFVPRQSEETHQALRERLSLNPHISIVPYHGHCCLSSLRFVLARQRLGMLGGSNVLQPALNLAIQMGYPDVYLVGADHSWHENLKFDCVAKRPYFDDTHFYGERRHAPEPAGPRTYVGFFNLARALHDYFEIAEFARRMGSNVTNISGKSYIDAFPFGDVPAKSTRA